MLTSAGTAALQAALDEAKVATAALQAQVEAASLSRQAAIDEAAAMSQKAELLQSQVDALNRTAADATAKLQESLSKMDGNRLVRLVHCFTW